MLETNVWRFSSVLVIPMLLLAVGCTEPAEPTQELRNQQAEEPCQPDDCVPLSPVLEPCPDGFELSSWSECVDADGECVWEFHDECVPTDEPDPQPEPDPDPEPQGNGGGHGHENQTPGDIRPRSETPRDIRHY